MTFNRYIGEKYTNSRRPRMSLKLLASAIISSLPLSYAFAATFYPTESNSAYFNQNAQLGANVSSDEYHLRDDNVKTFIYGSSAYSSDRTFDITLNPENGSDSILVSGFDMGVYFDSRAVTLHVNSALTIDFSDSQQAVSGIMAWTPSTSIEVDSKLEIVNAKFTTAASNEAGGTRLDNTAITLKNASTLIAKEIGIKNIQYLASGCGEDSISYVQGVVNLEMGGLASNQVQIQSINNTGTGTGATGFNALLGSELYVDSISIKDIAGDGDVYGMVSSAKWDGNTEDSVRSISIQNIATHGVANVGTGLELFSSKYSYGYTDASSISINGVTAEQSYRNSSGIVMRSDAELHAEVICIENIRNNGLDDDTGLTLDKRIGNTNSAKMIFSQSAVGLAANSISDQSIIKNLEIQNIQSTKGIAVGVLADNLSISNLVVSNINGGKLDYAIVADAMSSNKVGIDFGSASSPSIVEGDMYTLDGGELTSGHITGRFLNEASYFSGHTLAENQRGTVDLTFENGGSWYVPSDNEQIGTLNLLENGHVRLGYEKSAFEVASERTGFTRLTSSALNAGGGTMHFYMDIGKETNPELSDEIHTDQFSFGTLEDGEVLNAQLVLDGSDTNQQNHTNHWFMQQTGQGRLTVQGSFGPGQSYVSSNGSLDVWKIAFVKDSTEIDSITVEEASNTSDGAGYWYLVRPETGEEAPETPEVEQAYDLGTTVAQAIGWLAEKNDLRRRLGEVRYGAQTGAWAKAFARQDRASGFRGHGFKQEARGVHIGYDTFAHRDENSAWLVGATLRYARADQKGISLSGGGSGTLDSYSIKGYATWMHDSGAYADILAQVGYYDQEVRGVANDGVSLYEGQYASPGYGTSIELGRMFTLWNGTDDRRWHNHVFFEPQVELSYFYIEGQKFRFSTGLEVAQDNADFLTGRLGFVLGKKWSYAGTDDLDRRYFQLGLIAGVTKEFMGDQAVVFTDVDGKKYRVEGKGLGGHSYYYGITADWQVSNKLRFYGELDFEEGESYKKDYGINVGFKYSFD